MSKYVIMMLFLFSQPSIAMELEMSIFSKKKSSIQEESNQKRPFLSNKFKEKSKRLLALEQQVTQYRTEILPSLPIAQIRNAFCALPDDCKRKAFITMSTRMLLMNAVAKVLPTDVIKQILFFMLDKNMQAVEKFYNKPIGKAFELYHTIKCNLNDDAMPIGPLYAQSKAEREFVLQSINPSWYYSQPIITIEDQEKIGAMSEDMQQYFGGKKVKVLPSVEQVGCTNAHLGKAVCIACGWSLFGGTIFTGGCWLAGGSECICNPLFWGICFGMFGAPAVVVNGVFLLGVACQACGKTKEVTL